MKLILTKDTSINLQTSSVDPLRGNVFSADCFYGYLFPTGKGLKAIDFIFMVGDYPIMPDIKTYEIDLDERYIYQPIDQFC